MSSKKPSCGILVVDDALNKILLCRVTHQKHWDIPKWLIELSDEFEQEECRGYKVDIDEKLLYIATYIVAYQLLTNNLFKVITG